MCTHLLRPNGSLIGSTQQKPHRHDVVFFERNGLQHGEFPLASTSTPGDSGCHLHVQEVMWSSDSSILALWIVEKRRPQQATDEGSSSSNSSLETNGNVCNQLILSRITVKCLGNPKFLCAYYVHVHVLSLNPNIFLLAYTFPRDYYSSKPV